MFCKIITPKKQIITPKTSSFESQHIEPRLAATPQKACRKSPIDFFNGLCSLVIIFGDVKNSV